MKISRSSLTYLMRSGYMTLQVPQITIRLGGDPEREPDEIEIPDNWIMETKHTGGLWSQNERLTVGRERGYWHLSPVGWAANREAIREAWEAARTNPRGDLRRPADDRRDGGNTWEDFEQWVLRWFEKLERTMTAEIVKAEERVRALRIVAGQFELMRRG